MNLSTATKYSARDTATAALRKLGVTKADYDDFICRRDGMFYTDLEGARKFAAEHQEDAKPVTHVEAEIAKGNVKVKVVKTSVVKTVAAKVAPAKTVPTKAITTKTSDKAPNKSAVIRQMILDGKTNQEIWDTLSASGVLKENQKAYPSWYRTEQRNLGHAV